MVKTWKLSINSPTFFKNYVLGTWDDSNNGFLPCLSDHAPITRQNAIGKAWSENKKKKILVGLYTYIIGYGMEKIILKLSHYLILNQELLRNGKITWKQKLKQTHLSNINSNITLNFPALDLALGLDISCSIGRKVG